MLPKPQENERNNSFDLVRLIAALAVLVSHFYGMSGYPDPIDGFWGTSEDLGGLAVLVFFGLSGYLITESILKGASLKFYAASRSLRIYPALFACLIACIIAGTFLTRASLDQYFSSQTLQFLFGNLFPFFWQEQRFLPGVVVAMNAPLWTIKYELACYVVVLAVFIFPQSMRRLVFTVLFVLAACMWLAPIHSWEIPPASTVASRIIRMEYFNIGFFRYYAAIFFLAAVARIIVGNKPLHWFGIFMSLGLVLLFSYGTPIGLLTLLGILSLLGVCIGNSSLLYLNGFYRRRIGDLSYSTYLYGWPISFICALSFLNRFGFWPTMMISMAATLFVAWISWTVIERPFLRLKRRASSNAPLSLPSSIASISTSPHGPAPESI